MPPKAVLEPIWRDESIRINRGQNKDFEEHACTQPAPKNYVKKSQKIVIHSDSNDKPKPANIKAKSLLLCQLLFSANT